MKHALAALLFVASPAALGAEPHMALSDVKPGMKCVGRTVYSGQEIVEFGAELLGVVPQMWGPGEDVVLAKLTGPYAEKYGVVAGMSGSPIYCDGKLLGALSLSMAQFMREPIAGITPIDAMLRVGSRGWAPPIRGTGPRPQSGVTQMQPIASPVTMGGVAPQTLRIAEDLLAPFGLVATAGGAGGGPASMALLAAPDREAGKGLLPGSVVAGMLADGDLNFAATGTLSFREGDQVAAFGHSFLLYGDVEMPMATAEVIATIGSDMLSYKMAKPVAIVGAVTRDNRTAIAGTVGASASMIPVTVTLPEGSTPREVHFRVFRNKALSGPIITVGVMNGLVGNANFVAEGTVRFEGKIELEGYPDVLLTRTYFDPGSQGMAVPWMASELAATFQKLFDNDLAATQIKRVSVSLAIEKGHLETKVDAAWPDRTELRAGDPLTVRVRLKPYRGAPEVREIRVKVPESTPAGPLTIVAGDARSMDARDRIAPGQLRADDVGSLVAQFNQRRAEDALYVRVSRPGAGAIVKGTQLPSLPPDALAVIRGGSATAGGADALGDVVLDEVKTPLGARVTGAGEFTIQVKP